MDNRILGAVIMIMFLLNLEQGDISNLSEYLCKKKKKLRERGNLSNLSVYLCKKK